MRTHSRSQGSYCHVDQQGPSYVGSKDRHNVELLRKRTNLDSTGIAACHYQQSHWHGSQQVNSRMLATSGADTQEVSSTTESLTVDLSRDIVDGLNESLIPLTHVTREVGSRYQHQFRHQSHGPHELTRGYATSNGYQP